MATTRTLTVEEASRRVYLPPAATPLYEQAASCSEVKEQPFANPSGLAPFAEKEDDWSYIFVHHTKVAAMTALIDRLRATPPHAGEPEFIPQYFIHYSTKYVYDCHEKRRKTVVPTISGLVFLQGRKSLTRNFLKARFPGIYQVKDCATGSVAVIADAKMQPLKRVMEKDPTRIQILPNPLSSYAQGHIRVRVVTGDFQGWEGVVVRISRDRKLVLRLDNNLTIAVGRMHKEDFEAVGSLSS